MYVDATELAERLRDRAKEYELDYEAMREREGEGAGAGYYGIVALTLYEVAAEFQHVSEGE